MDPVTLGMAQRYTKGYAVPLGEQFVTPAEKGAKGDGVTVADAVITSGSNALTSASTTFTTASDAGKLIVVLPAPGSSQPTFATSITAGSAHTATLAANAPYSGSALEATYATDDTTALQAWLSDTSSRTRLLPGRTYGFTQPLKMPSHVGVLCSDGATLKVLAQLANPTGWPGGARIVPTALWSSFTVLNRQGIGWTGGTLDCSLLCDDGFAPKWMRGYHVRDLVVRAPKVRNFSLGDATTSSTSYENSCTAIRGWRDVGVVPTGGTALISGGTAGSVGCYTDANWTDSVFDGKCLMMGAQVGFDTRGSNISHYGSHAWARSSIGWMDYAFDDSSAAGTNNYVAAFSDTPQYIGFRFRGPGSNMIGCTAYNNNQYGTDNQTIAIRYDVSAQHRIIGNYFLGDDNTHRIAYTYDPAGTLPGYESFRFGNISKNVASVWPEIPPLRYSLTQSASYATFVGDAGHRVEMTNSTDATVTINTGKIKPGQQVEYVQMGTGKVLFAAGSGVTLLSSGGLTSTRAQYSTVTVTGVAAFENFVLSGDLG